MSENLFHGFCFDLAGKENITLMGDKLPGYWVESPGVVYSKNVYFLQNPKYGDWFISEMLKFPDALMPVIKVTFGVYTGANAENKKIFTGDKLQWETFSGLDTGIVKKDGLEFYVHTETAKLLLDDIIRSYCKINVVEQNYCLNI